MTAKETSNEHPPRAASRNRSVASTGRAASVGIAAGITALWSLYRVFWLFYAAATLSSVGYTGFSVVFPLVLWGAIAVLAGAVAAVFLLRYSKQP